MNIVDSMAADTYQRETLRQSQSREVTDEDIRAFKTTLLARRFPGVKNLPDQAIREIISADRRKDSRKVELRTYPKTEFHALTRSTSGPPPVWSPVCPSEAKDMAKRPDSECFTGINTPYDTHHADYVEDKISDETKRFVAPFRPTSTSQARDTIKVDYYLNSKDTELKQEELDATRRRGTQQMEQYMQQTTQRRGQMLV